ncbi:MAG: dihydropteroate synthase [Fuerstiella sp.]|nr:dihydropteroate synthase [Fuerstiella sp.]MCP4854689.1 dihydropteroate synthase [Fuerstiella sp.]
MGILNVTPDSFSDGGLHNQVDAAVTHGTQLVRAGADVIDVGGESTRPGAESIPLDEELARTIPVIKELSDQIDVPISIDTTKAEVARQALAAGAVIVNDISGLTFDPDMMSVCAEFKAAVCVMHIKGTPQAMQQNPVYQDVVQEVTEFLQARLSACAQAGIDPSRICIDPGIGFGKTAQHNLTLMQATARIRRALGRPILVGHSRKRFLSKLLGRPVEERNAGTGGVSVALTQNGADILRVHDVSATRDALTAWNAVRGTRSS